MADALSDWLSLMAALRKGPMSLSMLEAQFPWSRSRLSAALRAGIAAEGNSGQFSLTAEGIAFFPNSEGRPS